MQYNNDPTGPRIQISGVATWGRDPNFPVLLNETRYQGTHSTSWISGRHFLKFGADIQYVGAISSFPVDFGGIFTFASLADFTAGKVNTFTQGFGDASIHLPDSLYGFFVQDTFRVSNKLTVVYGMRYEYDAQPQGLDRDRSNPIQQYLQAGVSRDVKDFAPRAGLTYSLDSSAKTILRTGYGIFYDKLFLLAARNNACWRGWRSPRAKRRRDRATRCGARFRRVRNFPIGVPLPQPSLNITWDSRMDTPDAQQANFWPESRQLRSDWLAGASYTYVRGVRLLQSSNINLAPPTILTLSNAAALGVPAPVPQQIGRPYYTGRLNPAFNGVQEVSASGGSTYNSLDITLQKRFSHGFQFLVNYTFSKAIDNATDFLQAPSNRTILYTPSAERSVSDEDQRHRRHRNSRIWPTIQEGGRPERFPILRAVAAGLNSLSTLATVHSGIPYNVVVGSDVNGDQNSSTDRPLIGGVPVGRNTFTGPEGGHRRTL